MGGIRELLDGKIWEWDLSFRWEWEWDGNGNEVIEMGGNWYKKSVPAHFYPRVLAPTIWHLIWFIRCCRAYQCMQQTETQTDRQF